MISVPEEGPKEEATHTHQLSGASYVLPTEMYKAKGLTGDEGYQLGGLGGKASWRKSQFSNILLQPGSCFKGITGRWDRQGKTSVCDRPRDGRNGLLLTVSQGLFTIRTLSASPACVLLGEHLHQKDL